MTSAGLLCQAPGETINFSSPLPLAACGGTVPTAAPTGTLELRSPKRSPHPHVRRDQRNRPVASAALATYRFGRVAGEESARTASLAAPSSTTKSPWSICKLRRSGGTTRPTTWSVILISQGLLGGEPALTPRWDGAGPPGRRHRPPATRRSVRLPGFPRSGRRDVRLEGWSGDHLEQARVYGPPWSDGPATPVPADPGIVPPGRAGEGSRHAAFPDRPDAAPALLELAGVQQSLGNAGAAQELRQLAEPPPTVVKPSGTKPAS